MKKAMEQVGYANLAHIWSLQHARIIPNGPYFLGWPHAKTVGITSV